MCCPAAASEKRLIKYSTQHRDNSSLTESELHQNIKLFVLLQQIKKLIFQICLCLIVAKICRINVSMNKVNINIVRSVYHVFGEGLNVIKLSW